MPILKAILVVIEVITCFLLIGLILIQKSKSQGAGLAFGASMGESLFGAQTGNVLTKVTVWLTIIFLVNTTVLALMTPSRGASPTDTVTSRTPVSAAAPHHQAQPMPQTQPVPQTQAPVGGGATVPSGNWQQPDQPAAAPITIPAPQSTAVPVEQPAK